MSSLTELAEAQSTLPSPTEIRNHDARIEELNALVSTTHQTATDTMRQVQRLDRQIVPRDPTRMWRELVGPVVQLAGESSVGSGVLLRSEWDASRAEYRTYLITAWHVVRDIQGDLSNTSMPVPVNIYGEDRSIRAEEAKLLAFDVDLDAALLEVQTKDALPNGATLASRDQLESTRIFDRIYAVGCPLGNDPIPTPGEIATCNHTVEGELYWMINAPTYIGNSGGGIFDAQTHELLGIFSKIYTHGSLRPTIVPHMGLVTPLMEIYDWLDQEGYSSLVPQVRNASTSR
jgi:S1-C subfamily serine protease